MSQLEDRLEALLSNPEDMGKIAQMASRLMGQIAPPSAGPAPEPDGQGELLGVVGRIVSGLKDSGGKRQLLAGMAPYLAPSRRRRLEKALRLASAARLAGAALAEMGGDDGI